MLYCYGEKSTLRMLDEIVFWKRQEEEHTVVIRNLTRDLEEEYIISLESWEQAFAQSEGLAARYVEAIIRAHYNIDSNLRGQIYQFINFSLNQSKKFIQFLNTLTKESTAIKNNQTAIVVINHIRRESDYFIGITKAFLEI
ncbi:DUF2935 domain-containing protein [Sporosalibacterium faouarense]|uniref:DUF2935 domain-containing protein n=1 Tax=Sporosalibacterium faouarense TaxID=516123 RepID=UPI00141CCB61|nr:DUF2935 domain-containing protein [Sporosalibacterium faouarense]MTI49279.1 DUF2935 domain-containing protein [Bacillota bacterium]